jgi:hypothetical protein
MEGENTLLKEMAISHKKLSNQSSPLLSFFPSKDDPNFDDFLAKAR